MYTIAAIIGFAIGGVTLAYSGVQTAHVAFECFAFVTGGYLFGKFTK